MSHRLRTPFRSVIPDDVKIEIHIFPSSFYGLLDILSGTELNPGQRETGE